MLKDKQLSFVEIDGKRVSLYHLKKRLLDLELSFCMGTLIQEFGSAK